MTDRFQWQFGDVEFVDDGLDKFNPRHDERGRFASADLNNVVASALADKKGFTYNPVTVEAPKEGFAVGGYGTHDGVYDAKKFDGHDLQAFLDRNSTAIKGNYLGGWIDHGKVYLDVTKVFPPGEREAAIKAGKDLNQIAIADIAAINAGRMDQALIDTGGTGKAEAGKRTMFLLDPTKMTMDEMSAAITAMLKE